jgi:hypothetical protein
MDELPIAAIMKIVARCGATQARVFGSRARGDAVTSAPTRTGLLAFVGRAGAGGSSRHRRPSRMNSGILPTVPTQGGWDCG